MGDPQQQQDLSHLVPVDQDGAVSTPPQSHAEAAPLDKPQPSEDSAQDLSKLQPVEGSQRDVQPDLSKLQPVEGTQKQINQNVRTGGHVVSPSGVVRDDYGTNQHEEFLSGPGAGGTSISPAEHGFHAWLQDLQSDVRNGSDNTWFGSMLKKLGATGTASGVSEGTANAMESINPITAISTGLAQAGEHTINVLRADKGVANYVAQGHTLAQAVQLAYQDDPNLFKKNEIALNGMIGGVFKAAGPVVAAYAGPAAALESVPTVTGAMVAQHLAAKTAAAMGADPDTAELVGNVAAIASGHALNEKINPLTKRFGAAVSDRTAAEAEYNNRTRNLETARGQQVQAQSDALAAAQKESATHADPKATPEQKKAATDATVAARQNANDAAGNVNDAQKAHDIASKNRAGSIVQLEGLHRQIRTIADIENEKFDDRFTSESDKAEDYFRKAVPSKGAHQYTPEDYDVWRGYMEQAKKAGAKVNNFDDAYSATEVARMNIEKSLDPAVEKLKDNPITTNPFMDVQNGLSEAAKIEPGIQQEAADELSRYNLKDLTVGEARETIKRFNSQNRSTMKDKNNWDVNDLMAKDPAFAARYLAVQSLRDGFYGALKDAGVDGAEEARKEESSLIKMREAIGAQRRANRGGTAVRGSGNQNKLRGAMATLVSKGIKAYAIGKGAVMGGETGAILGSVAGDAISEPVSDLLAPRDITRDEHIQKSMELRGTLRQPTKIKGIEGAAPNRPSFELPPDVAEQMPTAVARVPRENTELHAELAAHYLDANGEYTYQQLEDRLRKDVSVKAANDPASVTPAEKTLLAKVIKLDKADAAAIEKANETRPVTKPSDASTADQQKDIKKIQVEAAVKSGKPAAGIEINPVLAALGRGDESGLVSESPAMKAHAKPLEIKGLEDGVNSDDVHREEWAHAALAAVDGLQPLEIRSDLHPKASEGAAATTAIAADQIKDEDGKYNPEMLKHQLVQWTTHKMAGPASHEIFRGATREELMSGNTHAADFREARSLVREVYPDWSAKQVNDYVNSAYDRAYNFLTKQHIADRIRTNASVRETGLPETLHASRGRLNQFAEDIRKAHNDAEGNDAGPDGGGAGEGSEKPAQKPESGAAGREGAGSGEEAANGKEKNEGRDSGRGEKEPRGDDGKGSNASGAAKSAEVVSKSGKGYTPSEKAETLSGEGKDYGPEFNAAQQQHQIDLYKSIARNPKATLEEKTFARERLTDLQNPDLREVTSAALRKSQIPPERTTGDTARDEAIKAGGGIPGGAMGDISMFHSPQTGSTLALKHADVTPERVQSHIKSSDATFGPEQKIAPEESSQARKKSSEVLADIQRSYGVHDDPKVERSAGFITPDARYIDLPVDHTQAIEEHGGPKAGGAKDNRQDFINDTGAIRVHKARERAGNVLAFSVPKDGVTPAQVEAMQRSFGANGDRNGVLRIERADISPETRNKLSTEQEFPTASQVKPMLEKIDGLREETSNANKGTAPKANEQNEVAKGADEFNAERGRDAVVPGTTHSPEVAKRIADAYDAMKHDPTNPAVKASYDAAKRDIQDQWNYARNKMGIKMEPWDKEGQPYANSKEMMKDVNDNKHLSFFRGGDIPADHPLAETDKDGLTYNDKLRAVHDLFGHAAQENQFGPKGEENAWNEHRQMFSPEALPAITSETRGQNSWVNYGKHLRDAEGNIPTKGQEGYVPPTERPFAEQKAGILPEEFHQPNGVEETSNANRSPKGSSVPLMKQPLDVEGTGEKGKVSTLDVAKALNEYSQEKNPALKHDEAEPKAMTDRAKKLAEDEAKYQLAQGRTGKEWYTEEMKDHDKTLLGMRPELAEGPSIDGVPGHTAKLSLFKAAEAVLSSGQKPYGNFKAAVNAWDAYQKTGEFPRLNPATGKSWGPRGEAAYGNALDMINSLVKEKGEKGAADWLLSNHPVSELKQYNPEGVTGKKTDEVPGAMILGAKRGPFMQNLHGLESAFTADMWVARSWNRWMGTIETGKNADGVEEIKSDSPRNRTERDLMKKSFSETADKLGLSTSSLQAVLWYYEQGLYRAHGVPKESWSFSDAAKRAAEEEKAPKQQSLFDHFGGASQHVEPQHPGAVHAFDFLNALRAGKK